MSLAKDNIERALTTLAEREKAYETALMRSASAEHAYKIKFAGAFLQGEGTVKEREMNAEQLCDAELKERLVSEAETAILKEKLRDCAAALSARQSILNFEVKIHGLTQNFTP